MDLNPLAKTRGEGDTSVKSCAGRRQIRPLPGSTGERAGGESHAIVPRPRDLHAINLNNHFARGAPVERDASRDACRPPQSRNGSVRDYVSAARGSVESGVLCLLARRPIMSETVLHK